MRYYLDCEFIEGPQQKYFLGIPWGKTKPTIDLISIGIYCEDGRSYYAISNDFNVREAWDRFQFNDGKKQYWIRDNVLIPIWDELVGRDYERLNGYPITATQMDLTWDLSPDHYMEFNYYTFKSLIEDYGKSNDKIADEIKKFIWQGAETNDPKEWGKRVNFDFYGYYSAYDWVVFCWLFGTMMELPDGFPIYCNDLGSWEEDYVWRMTDNEGYVVLKNNETVTMEKYKSIKDHPKYPRNMNEHNALEDARWNYFLHEFLEKYDPNKFY